jgi:hypothetical protein
MYVCKWTKIFVGTKSSYFGCHFVWLVLFCVVEFLFLQCCLIIKKFRFCCWFFFWHNFLQHKLFTFGSVERTSLIASTFMNITYIPPCSNATLLHTWLWKKREQERDPETEETLPIGEISLCLSYRTEFGMTVTFTLRSGVASLGIYFQAF